MRKKGKTVRTIFKNKHAQVAIFIIIAIIIVVGIAIVFLVTKSSSKSEEDREAFSQSEIKAEVSDIQSSIIDCTEDITENALGVIGVQGGYYELLDSAEDYFDLEWAFVPYFYKEGDYLMPSRMIIESELNKYVEENLNTCLDELDFSNFELNYKIPQVKAKINPGEVVFSIDHPITIKKENSKITLELKDYPVSHMSALEDILEVANYYVESHKGDNYLICISCLGEMAEEKNLYIDIIDFDELSTLVVISENYTSSDPYSFEFLNKYTGLEEPTDIPVEDADVAPGAPVVEE